MTTRDPAKEIFKARTASGNATEAAYRATDAINEILEHLALALPIVDDQTIEAEDMGFNDGMLQTLLVTAQQAAERAKKHTLGASTHSNVAAIQAEFARYWLTRPRKVERGDEMRPGEA